MIDVKDILINFNGLIKNRKGPYNIVLVSNVDGKFIGFNNEWYSLLQEAFKYNECEGAIRRALFRDAKRYNGSIHLTTVAGFIRLFDKDFKNEWNRD